MTLEGRFPKRVVFTARLGPNFLWHVLAVARIGYDSEYADRFAGTLPPDAMAALREHDALLRFGNGETGGMTGFFTFLPGFLHVESGEDFERYFATISRCLEKASFRDLPEAFPGADWSDPWFRAFPETTAPVEPADRAAFAAISAAYLAGYDTYRQRVWPEARSRVAERAAGLNAWFAAHDYIRDWEAFTGLAFASPRYEIVLCYANRNGPDYNSLGYGGNLFYWDKPFERTWQFASHEIGTHILMDAHAEVSRDPGSEAGRLHRAYEVMCMFLNRLVLGLPRLAYDMPPAYGHERLLALFETVYRPGMIPASLLREALARDAIPSGA